MSESPKPEVPTPQPVAKPRDPIAMAMSSAATRKIAVHANRRRQRKFRLPK